MCTSSSYSILGGGGGGGSVLVIAGTGTIRVSFGGGGGGERGHLPPLKLKRPSSYTARRVFMLPPKISCVCHSPPLVTLSEIYPDTYYTCIITMHSKIYCETLCTNMSPFRNVLLLQGRGAMQLLLKGRRLPGRDGMP